MKLVDMTSVDGIVWRTYKDDEGAEHKTAEVPVSVLSLIGKPKLKAQLEVESRKAEVRRRDARVRALLAEDWKPLAVARELGIGVSTVRDIAKRS